MKPFKLAILVAAFGALVSLVPAQTPTPLFQTLEEPIPREASQVLESGDFDGDGNLDLLCLGGLYLGDGRGSFRRGSSPDFRTALGNNLRRGNVRVGDFDGDGSLDVVGLNLLYPPGAQLSLNSGSGTLSGFANVFPPLPPTAIASNLLPGDVDADGDLDLVVLNHIPGPHSINAAPPRLWINDGAGNFSDASAQLAPILVTGPGAVLVDVDGDTDLDLVTLIESVPGGPRLMLLNDGIGNFSPATWLPNLGSSYSTLEAIDMDGDGLRDLVARCQPGVGPSGLEIHRVRVGAPWVSSFTSLSPGKNYAGVLDMDGDGLPELLLHDYSQLLVRVLAPNGSVGPVLQSLPYFFWSAQQVPLRCDVDGDGDEDLLLDHELLPPLIYWNGGQGSFVPHRALAPSRLSKVVPAGDLDGDGFTDLMGTVYDYQSASEFLAPAFGDGSGGFALAAESSWTPSPSFTPSLHLFDADGDGVRELFTPGGSAFLPSQLFSLSASGLSLISNITVPSDVASSRSADLDGDGLPELILIRRPAFGNHPAIPSAILPNLGGGLFGPAITLPGNFHAWDIAIADADGDGDLDLFLASRSLGDFTPTQGALLLNQGGLSFSLDPNFTPPASFGVIAADLDGDGDQDVLFGNQIYGNAGPQGLTLQTPLSGPDLGLLSAGDVNGDGLVDIVTGTRWYANLGALSFAPGQPFENNSGSIETNLTPGPFVSLSSLADLDQDGDLDVIDSRGRIFSNRSRQLAMTAIPRTGGIATLEVHGPPGSSFVLAGGLGTATIPTPFGTLLLDPNNLVVQVNGLLPLDGTPTRFNVSVPPGIAGATAHWQALFPAQGRLSGRKTTIAIDL